MLVGRVDDYGRPLVSVVLKHPVSGAALTVDAWIDTAFQGDLLLPEKLVQSLALPVFSSMPGHVASSVSDLCLRRGVVRPKPDAALAGQFHCPSLARASLA
jgi:hypothetical protein